MTVRRWAFLAALLLLLAQIVAAPSAQAAVYPCLGAPADEPNGGLYPEPRIFLENQAWWQPTVFGTENHGHIHTAACFPRTTYADGSPVKVSGAMPVAIRTILHDNPGLLRYARVHLTTDKSNHAGAFRDDIGENCVEGGPHWNQATLGCVWWSTGTINTAISEFDGYQEMRFSGNVLHANSGTSDTAFSSGGWQVYLSNGKPVQHYRSDASVARYGNSITKTTGAAAAPIATLSTGSARDVRVYEVGISVSTAVSGEVGLMRPANSPATPSGGQVGAATTRRYAAGVATRRTPGRRAHGGHRVPAHGAARHDRRRGDLDVPARARRAHLRRTRGVAVLRPRRHVLGLLRLRGVDGVSRAALR
jgi:hypothetical protein